jgi:RNA polymerase sigma factor (sigma-70 family)
LRTLATLGEIKGIRLEKDLQLIQAIGAGDQLALRHLYEFHHLMVYNTALSFTKNQVEAEEVTQDVFLKIYKSTSGFDGKSKLSTWIYRITINTALNQIKANKKFSFLQFGNLKDHSAFEHPGVSSDKKEEAKILYQVIESLVINQKTAFILSYIEELPRQEVADIMELSLKAVESLLQRAKKTLREQLKNRYPHRRNYKK